MLKREMVRFPSEGDGLEHSGEGGIYVIMVVPEPWEHDGHNAHVDVHATLSRPDVCLSARRTEIWEPYDHAKLGSGRVYQALTAKGENELAQWALRATHDSEISAPLLASVFLGSSGVPLWSSDLSAYWTAGVDDLTEAGKALYDGLKAAYGVEPVLLTFLDT